MPQLGNGGSQEGAQSNGNANNPGNKQSRKSHSKSTNSFGGDSSRFGKHDPHPGIGPGPSGAGGSLTPGMTRMGLPSTPANRALSRAMFGEVTRNPVHGRMQTEDMGLFARLAHNPMKTLSGALPGLDYSPKVSAVTDKVVGNDSPTFSVSRALGDLVGIGAGIPGIGDMAHAVANADIAGTLGGLFGSDTETAGLNDQSNTDRSNDLARALMSTPEETAQKQDEKQKEVQAIATALTGRPGFTRAGMGTVFT